MTTDKQYTVTTVPDVGIIYIGGSDDGHALRRIATKHVLEAMIEDGVKRCKVTVHGEAFTQTFWVNRKGK